MKGKYLALTLVSRLSYMEGIYFYLFFFYMKVEEPKTPFNYANPDDQICDEVDADVLAER